MTLQLLALLDRPALGPTLPICILIRGVFGLGKAGGARGTQKRDRNHLPSQRNVGGGNGVTALAVMGLKGPNHSCGETLWFPPLPPPLPASPCLSQNPVESGGSDIPGWSCRTYAEVASLPGIVQLQEVSRNRKASI